MVQEQFYLGLFKPPGSQLSTVVALCLLLHYPCGVNYVGAPEYIFCVDDNPHVILDHLPMFAHNRCLPGLLVWADHGLLVTHHLQLIGVIDTTANTSSKTPVFSFFLEFTKCKMIILFGCSEGCFTISSIKHAGGQLTLPDAVTMLAMGVCAGCCASGSPFGGPQVYLLLQLEDFHHFPVPPCCCLVLVPGLLKLPPHFNEP